MIEGHGFHQANVMMLELTQPGRAKAEYIPVMGSTREEREEKAWKIVLERNQKRVSETMCSWLKQRQYCLEQYDMARAQQAQKLLVLMHYCSDFHYIKLCKMIAGHRTTIEFLAPSEKSRFRGHYLNVILPLIEECDLMKDGFKK